MPHCFIKLSFMCLHESTAFGSYISGQTVSMIARISSRTSGITLVVSQWSIIWSIFWWNRRTHSWLCIFLSSFWSTGIMFSFVQEPHIERGMRWWPIIIYCLIRITCRHLLSMSIGKIPLLSWSNSSHKALAVHSLQILSLCLVSMIGASIAHNRE